MVVKDRILIVEDDLEFARFVTVYLAKQGFEAETVATGAELFEKLETRSYDCMIIDLTLPDEDGIVLVRKLRARSEVPILVLTGRVGIDDKLVCFEVGADDYVTKPVDPRELVVRLRAVMRRYDGPGSPRSGVLNLGRIALDLTRREANREDGSAVDLTPAEFSLLWVLANADGRVSGREELIDAISSGEGPLSTRSIDILVSRVRKKLDKDVILTVPTLGYRCGWPVSRGDGPSLSS